MQETPAWAIIIHLLGAAIFVGASFGSLVVVMRGELVSASLKRLQKLEAVAMYAVILQIVIGGYLFSLDAANFGKSPAFGLKMVALIAAGALSGMLVKKIKVAQTATGVLETKQAQTIKRFTVAVFAAALTVVILGFALAATA